MSLVEMLENLRQGGITLAPEISLNEIEEEFNPEDGYKTLLCILGNDTEDHRELPRSHKIWHLDTECIYGDGSYIWIARRLKLLAGDALPIEEITDYVEEKEAMISFILDGQRYEWDLAVDSDWVDPAIFTRFANLLKAQQQGVRFTYQGLAQNCLIGCATPEQLQLLNSLPGINFEWLS